MKTDEINTAKKTEENYQKIFAEYKSYTGDEPFVFVSYAHDDFEKVRYFLIL